MHCAVGSRLFYGHLGPCSIIFALLLGGLRPCLLEEKYHILHRISLDMSNAGLRFFVFCIGGPEIVALDYWNNVILTYYFSTNILNFFFFSDQRRRDNERSLSAISTFHWWLSNELLNVNWSMNSLLNRSWKTTNLKQFDNCILAYYFHAN